MPNREVVKKCIMVFLSATLPLVFSSVSVLWEYRVVADANRVAVKGDR